MNSYYIIFDVSNKKTSGYSDRLYFECHNSTNILYQARGFIKDRELSNLRIFRFNTKREYDNSYALWCLERSKQCSGFTDISTKFKIAN